MDKFLSQIKADLAPSQAAKKRIHKQLKRSIEVPNVLNEVSKALEPEADLSSSLWNRILQRAENDVPASVLSQASSLLPDSETKARIKLQVMNRIAVMSPAMQSFRLMKWTAAFAVFAIAVRLSPALFIAPPTVAESVVRLVTTRGAVEVSVAGKFKPVQGELVLEPGMILRTQNGEASVLFHDDGVIRLDAHTSVAINDTQDRPLLTDATTPTFTLYTGRLWVQGLIPGYTNGITVATSYGDITVNDASISIAEDSLVDVHVFNRRATVKHNNHYVVLVSGERTQMWEANIPLVKKISEENFADAWNSQNLSRDAVHRSEIAQLQQEIKAAQAGILPSSPFYSVKRVAEAADVFFAFGKEAKAQRQLTHANTRLNEAAALLAEDETEQAKGLLDEYQQALVALADDADARIASILEQSVTEASASTTAALPSDDSYLLKQVVLEAGLEVDGVAHSDDIKGVLVADTLALLASAVEAGEVADVRRTWLNLQPHLASLETENSMLGADVRKEIKGLLATLAVAVDERKPQMLALDAELVDQVNEYLPAEPQDFVKAMTEDELMTIVQGIRERIFLYNMTKSRINQYIAERKALAGHPEQGRILRRLYFALPGGPENFPERVKKEITMLRWSRAGEVI